MKSRKGERETIGVELYGVQQELARHQMMLESHHDQYSKLAQESAAITNQLGDVRNQYKDRQFKVIDEKKKGIFNEYFKETDIKWLDLFVHSQVLHEYCRSC